MSMSSFSSEETINVNFVLSSLENDERESLKCNFYTSVRFITSHNIYRLFWQLGRVLIMAVAFVEKWRGMNQYGLSKTMTFVAGWPFVEVRLCQHVVLFSLTRFSCFPADHIFIAVAIYAMVLCLKLNKIQTAFFRLHRWNKHRKTTKF